MLFVKFDTSMCRKRWFDTIVNSIVSQEGFILSYVEKIIRYTAILLYINIIPERGGLKEPMQCRALENRSAPVF